ncbi:hypothetical protein Ddc_24585 [Ditylenchus destructor]|nr:hypothetical protein Ddc_24585 [Ditylenchus destructor]
MAAEVPPLRRRGPELHLLREEAQHAHRRRDQRRPDPHHADQLLGRGGARGLHRAIQQELVADGHGRLRGRAQHDALVHTTKDGVEELSTKINFRPIGGTPCRWATPSDPPDRGDPPGWGPSRPIHLPHERVAGPG